MDALLMDYPNNIVSMELNYSISEELYRKIYIIGGDCYGIYFNIKTYL